jgi:myb proto-oncogene protein
MGQFTLYIELLNEITKFTYTHVLNYSCLCEKNTMKKKVNPTTATDPVLKALAAYQAHQDSMNPINSVDQLESSVSMVGKVGLLTNEATTSSEQPM